MEASLEFEIPPSRVVIFIVGPNRKRHEIDAELIAVTSPFFRAMISGRWNFDMTSTIPLEDVEDDVFETFFHYAKTGAFVKYEDSTLECRGTKEWSGYTVFEDEQGIVAEKMSEIVRSYRTTWIYWSSLICF